MLKRVANAKIACLDFSLQKAKMKLGVQIVVDDPNKLDAIRDRLALDEIKISNKIFMKLIISILICFFQLQ
jgi:chaperonin GroEL (HSP60 family)